MNERKTFPLAGPSCLIPGTVAENCLFLQHEVREIGLALFETESCIAYSSRDLTGDIAFLGLSYHAHLPLDLPWGNGAGFVFERVSRLLDKVAYLEPERFVLHPPERPGDLEEFASLWVGAGFNPRSLLVENIRGHDLAAHWRSILDLDLGVCLDLGHILAYSQEGLLQAKSLWDRVGLVHVYGIEVNGAHLGLEYLDREGERVVDLLLGNIPEGTVLLLELFSWEEFAASRDILSKLLLKRGMDLDYPDFGRE